MQETEAELVIFGRKGFYAPNSFKILERLEASKTIQNWPDWRAMAPAVIRKVKESQGLPGAVEFKDTQPWPCDPGIRKLVCCNYPDSGTQSLATTLAHLFNRGPALGPDTLGGNTVQLEFNDIDPFHLFYFVTFC